jgi:outer membrane protein OmpA-like peptidoglycan-associated protein
VVDKEQNEVVFKLDALPKKTVSIPVAIVDQFTGESIGAQLNVTGAKLASAAPPLLTANEGERVSLNVSADGYVATSRSFMATDSLTRPVTIRMGKAAYEFVFRTVSEKTRKPVLDANVVILQADTRQRIAAETSYDKTPALLSPQHEYIIAVTVAGFEDYQLLFKPQEALKNNTVKRDLLLSPVMATAAASPAALVIETRSFGKVEKGKAILLNNLYFDQSSPVLRPESFVQLDELVAVLTQNPAVRIEIRGYTDNQGDFDQNVKLSRERCQAVIDYVSRKGIQPTRMQAVGRGPLDPVAPNTTEESRRKNRRVEFVVL